MVLALPDHWVWDFWHCHDGRQHHLFFLKAPRALRDPELRHWNVTIGHAVSVDLRTWQVRADALSPGESGAWDDYTTWTGCVVGRPGDWAMLYTGSSHRDAGLVQRIGLARSSDLETWIKHPHNPVVEADPQWYELLDLGQWHDQAWRDPWVVVDAISGVFRMFITARKRVGPTRRRGVIGHAASADLEHWEVGPPLDTPHFSGQMEIPQVIGLAGRWFLLYSAEADNFDEPPDVGGTFVLVADDPLGPFRAQPGGPLVRSPWYGARIVAHEGRPYCLAWRGTGDDGEFAGIVGDPIPVVVDAGMLALGAGEDRA